MSSKYISRTNLKSFIYIDEIYNDEDNKLLKKIEKDIK